MTAVIALVLAASSAHAQPPAPLRMRDLPALAVPLEQPSPALTHARGLLQRSFAIRLRRPPARLNTVKFTRWARTVFAPWVQRKRTAVDAVAQSLTALAASSAPPVREIAAAAGMQAAAYDDLAVAVLTLPTPLELQRDPQLARVYREALDSAVAPMLRQAVDAYDVCIARAVAPDWLAFCRTRAAALRATGLIPTTP